MTRKRPKLRRVESKEHLLDDEEYVVVDFVGNVEVSSRRSSATSLVVDPSALEVEYADDADISKDDENLEKEQKTIAEPSELPVSVTVNSPSPTFVNADEAVVDDDEDVVISEAEMKTTNEIEVEEPSIQADPTTIVVKANVEVDDSQPLVTEAPLEAATSAYSAGKGLKGLKKTKTTLPSKEKEPVSPQWTTTVEASLPAVDAPSPTEEVTKLDDKAAVEEPKPAETLSRSSSNRSTGSASLSRKGSSKDRSKDRPISQVLQNKLLFDSQISNQWKRKEPSPEGSHRSSNSSLNSSSSRRSSIRSMSEKPVSGTVAGARSMFESKKPPSKPPKAAWSAKLESDTNATVPETKPLETQPEVLTAAAPKKKKRFPFKKKKATAAVTSDPTKETPSSDSIAKQPTEGGVELVAVNAGSVEPPTVGYEERAIDVPGQDPAPVFDSQPQEDQHREVEPTKEKKKKKPGLISRITHRRSRKSSGGDTEESVPEKETPSSPVIAPEEPSKPAVVVDENRVEPPSAAVTIVSNDDESKPGAEPSPSLDLLSEIDTSLALAPDKRASTVLVSDNDDDIPPPSPAQASKEVKSVLESIIDRKPIDVSASTTSLNPDDDDDSNTGDNDPSIKKKKKKLVLKKRTKAKKDPAAPAVVDDDIVVIIPGMEDKTIIANADKPALTVSTPMPVDEDVIAEEVRPTEPVVEMVQHDQVEENDIEESVSVKVDADVSKQDWPEEMISDVAPAAVDNNNVIGEKPITAETVTDPSIPEIAIEVSSPDHNTTDPDLDQVSGQQEEAPFLDVDLHKDDDTISITSNTSTSTEKKKKKRFKFPLRKSSSKKHKQQLQDNPPSPTKDVDIWETPIDGEGGKLEKKNSSKKLKRPKSLDFLGEIIHPTHKHKNENGKSQQQQRPVSMAAHNDNDSLAESPQKSPAKHRRSFNLFKKKKNHHHSQVDGDAHPSPLSGAEDADVFKIPDVVDSAPDVVGDNGHVSVSLTVAGQSD